MANFFKDAKSEYSQDLFLHWLFECAKDNDDSDPSYFGKRLLLAFMGKGPSGMADLIVTENLTQICDMDIFVKGTYAGNPFFVVIEDKTFSTLHPSKGKDGKNVLQTEKYMETLNEWKKNDDQKCTDNPKKETHIYGIVYKTSFFNPQEKEAIPQSASSKKDGENVWTRYDINDIDDLFYQIAKERTPKHDLLMDYIAMLNDWTKKISSPGDDVRNWSLTDGVDRLVWEHFFLNNAAIDRTNFIYSSGVYHGSYLWIHIEIKNQKKTLPIIELRPRDFFKESKNKGSFSLVACFELFHTKNRSASNADFVAKVPSWQEALSEMKGFVKSAYPRNTSTKESNQIGKCVIEFLNSSVSQKEFTEEINSMLSAYLTALTSEKGNNEPS
jgi:hypothetical protein